MGKNQINNLLLSLPLVDCEQVTSSLRLLKVKPKVQPASALPKDDCWLCIVQWACPTCLSGVCATTSMQTNRNIPRGIWLSQVNLTQPHSSIKGYFGQMSGGALRVLVKCLRVCAPSVKQRQTAVQDDTTDLYLEWRTRAVGLVRQIRCAESLPSTNKTSLISAASVVLLFLKQVSLILASPLPDSFSISSRFPSPPSFSPSPPYVTLPMNLS